MRRALIRNHENASLARAARRRNAGVLLPAFAAPADWFPPSDMMTIGVYYYPEAWPEAQWGRDMANMRKLGMEFVHMGEFAWYFMEPEEGKYRLDWLEKNVDLAAANGLKVILCTPSATPPIWLTRKHPEILMVDCDRPADESRRARAGRLELAALSRVRDAASSPSWPSASGTIRTCGDGRSTTS